MPGAVRLAAKAGGQADERVSARGIVGETASPDTVAVLIGLEASGFVALSPRNPLWVLAAGTSLNVAGWHFG